MRENVQPISYAAFLADDPRRSGDALEIGHDFTEADHRYRVCWYVATSEVTFERLEGDDETALDLHDFHAGIATVEVIARVDRETLEQLLGRWPDVEHCQPRTLARVRERLALA